MQITLTDEQQSQLSLLAAEEGKRSDELVQDLLNRGLAEEARFVTAVKLGQDAAKRGDFIDASQVWAEIEQVLQA